MSQKRDFKILLLVYEALNLLRTHTYLYERLGGLFKMFVLIQLLNNRTKTEVKLSAHVNQGITVDCQLSNK